MFSDAEQALDAFLTKLPEFQRKQFEQGFSSLTPEEADQLFKWMATAPEAVGLKDEYVRLLQSIPAKARDYRRREKSDHMRYMVEPGSAAIPAGRPRQDALAHEAAQLKESDLPYAQVASSSESKVRRWDRNCGKRSQADKQPQA